jgi:hypothetical protein
MKVLHLTLKKKWFDMIASGEKKEEYREIKPYWASRFNPTGNLLDPCRDFNIVELKNGYSKNAPTIRLYCKEITIDEGREEWGAEPNKEYYVIKLGKILVHQLQ